MHPIAFIFSRVPHGSTLGLEGLNAAIAVGSLNKNIGIFFIGDGVFQLVANQIPEVILSKHYAPTFYVLKLYDIKRYYVCLDSLINRGLSTKEFNILNVKIINSKILRKKLISYNHILTF
ncbi:sulfurtransferase complex subunit TusC [Candidatus Pantoea edessiphila]|uniref:Sulfurtransferase complex subunit TusC n=1 Tax=Candidatus Pantoea edessiphila TaxID=2044610 RepID=A0A2P5SVY6_9GAMM|nr:sulfurtransferase complex subunit TusC [Candidatus Pantoea edessiphila]PPI86481.1 sulfurtransferase complex subunit TusC [Candidatus Pantoea edessiphila]